MIRKTAEGGLTLGTRVISKIIACPKRSALAVYMITTLIFFSLTALFEPDITFSFEGFVKYVDLQHATQTTVGYGNVYWKSLIGKTILFPTIFITGLATFGALIVIGKNFMKRVKVGGRGIIMKTKKNHTIIVAESPDWAGKLADKLINSKNEIKDIIVCSREEAEELSAGVMWKKFLGSGIRDCLLGMSAQRASNIIIAMKDDSMASRIRMQINKLNPDISTVAVLEEGDVVEDFMALGGKTICLIRADINEVYMAVITPARYYYNQDERSRTGRVDGVEITVPKNFIGATRDVLDPLLSKTYNVTLLYVLTQGTLIINPDQGYKVEGEDVLGVNISGGFNTDDINWAELSNLCSIESDAVEVATAVVTVPEGIQIEKKYLALHLLSEYNINITHLTREGALTVRLPLDYVVQGGDILGIDVEADFNIESINWDEIAQLCQSFEEEGS